MATTSCWSLLECVRQAEAAGIVGGTTKPVIRWKNGGTRALGLAGMQRAMKVIGRTVVLFSIPGGVERVGTIAEVRTWVRQADEGMMIVLEGIQRVRSMRAEWTWRKKLVVAVEQHDYQVLALVYGCTDRTLLGLWRLALARHSDGGRRVMTKVREIMQQRHQLRVKQRYVVRVPFLPGPRAKGMIRKFVIWNLRRSTLPVEWMQEVALRLTVSFTRRRNLGEILDNHHHFF